VYAVAARRFAKPARLTHAAVPVRCAFMHPQPGSVQSRILADIPRDLPFLLRLKPWRHVWHHLRLPMAVFTPLGLALVVLVVVSLSDPSTTSHSDTAGDVPTPWIGAMGLLFGIFMILGMPLEIAWRVSRGPVLGADRGGVYLQPRIVRTRTLYLPWELIESATIRRWRGPYLCLKPKKASLDELFSIANSSPALGSRNRAGKIIVQKLMLKRLGTNIVLPVGGAPEGPQGVLDTLRQWSGGKLGGYSVLG
jgi:hypothetical protein